MRTDARKPVSIYLNALLAPVVKQIFTYNGGRGIRHFAGTSFDTIVRGKAIIRLKLFR